MPGFVAPATEIVQPSQLIPASQYTWIVLSGPSGKRSRAGSSCVSGVDGSPPLMTSRSTIAMTWLLRALADARQLISLQHVHDPVPAHPGLEHHQSLRIANNLADDPGVPPLIPPVHGGQYPVGTLRCNDCQQLPLIGDIQGIEAEELADS